MPSLILIWLLAKLSLYYLVSSADSVPCVIVTDISSFIGVHASLLAQTLGYHVVGFHRSHQPNDFNNKQFFDRLSMLAKNNTHIYKGDPCSFDFFQLSGLELRWILVTIPYKVGFEYVECLQKMYYGLNKRNDSDIAVIQIMDTKPDFATSLDRSEIPFSRCLEVKTNFQQLYKEMSYPIICMEYDGIVYGAHSAFNLKPYITVDDFYKGLKVNTNDLQESSQYIYVDDIIQVLRMLLSAFPSDIGKLNNTNMNIHIHAIANVTEETLHHMITDLARGFDDIVNTANVVEEEDLSVQSFLSSQILKELTENPITRVDATITLDRGLTKFIRWYYEYHIQRRPCASFPFYQQAVVPEKSKNTTSIHREKNLCIKSGWDQVVKVSRAITKHCDIVMYTIAISRTVNTLHRIDPRYLAFTSHHQVCALAFVSAESPLGQRNAVNRLIERLNDITMRKFIKAQSEQAKFMIVAVRDLSGHFKNDRRSSRPMKLLPDTFFHDKVKYALSIDSKLLLTTSIESIFESLGILTPVRYQQKNTGIYGNDLIKLIINESDQIIFTAIRSYLFKYTITTYFQGDRVDLFDDGNAILHTRRKNITYESDLLIRQLYYYYQEYHQQQLCYYCTSFDGAFIIHHFQRRADDNRENLYFKFRQAWYEEYLDWADRDQMPAGYIISKRIKHITDLLDTMNTSTDQLSNKSTSSSVFSLESNLTMKEAWIDWIDNCLQEYTLQYLNQTALDIYQQSNFTRINNLTTFLTNPNTKKLYLKFVSNSPQVKTQLYKNMKIILQWLREQDIGEILLPTVQQEYCSTRSLQQDQHQHQHQQRNLSQQQRNQSPQQRSNDCIQKHTINNLRLNRTSFNFPTCSKLFSLIERSFFVVDFKNHSNIQRGNMTTHSSFTREVELYFVHIALNRYWSQMKIPNAFAILKRLP